MSIEEATENGEWASALALIQEALVSERSLAMLCQLFDIQSVTEQFDAAEITLDEITTKEGGRSGTVEMLTRCLQGDRLLSARRANPELPPSDDRFGSDVQVKAHREALGHHARGEYRLAREKLRSARALRGPHGGTVFDHSGLERRFTSVTDVDELVGPHLVCTTHDGLTDIPYHLLRRIEIRDGTTFHDTLWRPADCWLRDADEPLQVRIPTLYSGTGRHPEPDVRCARLCVKDYGRGYAIASGPRALAFQSPHGWRVDRLVQFAKIVFED